MEKEIEKNESNNAFFPFTINKRYRYLDTSRKSNYISKSLFISEKKTANKTIKKDIYR
jgi:hypothetical protein